MLIPPIQSKYVGQNAIFYCITKGTIEWFFQRGPLPNNVAFSNEIFGSKMTINDVTLDNGGVYLCLIRSKYAAQGELIVFCEL